jgi:hypothetical protein
MEGYKTYRHKDNPAEKVFHDKFIELFSYDHDDISRVVFSSDERTGGMMPRDYLNPREEQIVISTIQWLGSPVGQNFLIECGFKKIL